MAQTKNNYKVRLKTGDAEIEVEGAESGVVKIVQALSEVIRGSRRGSTLVPSSLIQPSNLVPIPTTQRSMGHTDIRSFFEEKKPSSDIEAAAVASYYYQYLAPQRRDTIDAAGLQEAFRLAKRPLPARTIYTLTNARNAGYLDSTGEGEFRLNPVGYNLVEHGLGSSAGDKEEKPKKKRRRRSKN